MIKLQSFIKECEGCDREQAVDWTNGQDHEGYMAKSELKDMIMNAAKLHKMLGPDDQLPGWVSSYISLASDYIHSVTEHLAGKIADPEMQGNLPSAAIYETDNDTPEIINHWKTEVDYGRQDRGRPQFTTVDIWDLDDGTFRVKQIDDIFPQTYKKSNFRYPAIYPLEAYIGGKYGHVRIPDKIANILFNVQK